MPEAKNRAAKLGGVRICLISVRVAEVRFCVKIFILTEGMASFYRERRHETARERADIGQLVFVFHGLLAL